MVPRSLDKEDEDDFEELHDRLQKLMAAIPEKCYQIFELGYVEAYLFTCNDRNIYS